MRIEDRISGKAHDIEAVPVISLDYQQISTSRFRFNWEEEKGKDILGLMSLESDMIMAKRNKDTDLDEFKYLIDSRKLSEKDKEADRKAILKAREARFKSR